MKFQVWTNQQLVPSIEMLEILKWCRFPWRMERLWIAYGTIQPIEHCHSFWGSFELINGYGSFANFNTRQKKRIELYRFPAQKKKEMQMWICKCNRNSLSEMSLNNLLWRGSDRYYNDSPRLPANRRWNHNAQSCKWIFYVSQSAKIDRNFAWTQNPLIKLPEQSNYWKLDDNVIETI